MRGVQSPASDALVVGDAVGAKFITGIAEWVLAVLRSACKLALRTFAARPARNKQTGGKCHTKILVNLVNLRVSWAVCAADMLTFVANSLADLCEVGLADVASASHSETWPSEN